LYEQEKKKAAQLAMALKSGKKVSNEDDSSKE